MQTSEVEQHKTENTQLRDEVKDWKKKYYDCRRKVVAHAQYVRTSLPRFAIDTYMLMLVNDKLIQFMPVLNSLLAIPLSASFILR